MSAHSHRVQPFQGPPGQLCRAEHRHLLRSAGECWPLPVQGRGLPALPALPEQSASSTYAYESGHVCEDGQHAADHDENQELEESGQGSVQPGRHRLLPVLPAGAQRRPKEEEASGAGMDPIPGNGLPLPKCLPLLKAEEIYGGCGSQVLAFYPEKIDCATLPVLC
eukprot:scaffold39224_cov48-Prasinocladus_malaysianus.AAC.2